MSATEKYKELLFKEAKATKRIICLAYLQLHVENPALHPDNHLSSTGGYEGWLAILVKTVWDMQHLPENFRYPTAFLRAKSTLKTFESFHADDSDDMEYAGFICSLQEFIADFDSKQLQYAAECAMKLYLFHATEDDDEQAINDIRDISDVLTWISQLY